MTFRRLLTFACAVVLCALPLTSEAQFAHTSGKQILDPEGKPLLIHGTNLGNWMVPEGYMWGFEGGPQSASEIENLVQELLGPEGSAAFWKQYRARYVTLEDIQLLHRSGFNTIRIPMHWKLFDADDAEGFALLDQVLGWCRQEHLYVILDMHAAPGGQTGANIDDSYAYPWLYDSPQEQAHLATIWQRIARRYAGNATVIGYDVLNEPIPHYPAVAVLNPKLEPVYKKLTAAIRQVDTHHILFLGGAQWDSNFSVFGAPFDSNMAYTFHKYWSATDQSVIQPYLDFRDKYNVPLWMGESGENTDDWIARFVTLLNAHDIGWTFWPYKKMLKTSAVVTIAAPDGWDQIVAFAKLPRGTGNVEERLKARPSQEAIRHAFAGLLENIELAHCTVNQGYLTALFHPSETPQPATPENRPARPKPVTTATPNPAPNPTAQP